jgi:hypothetical protein
MTKAEILKLLKESRSRRSVRRDHIALERAIAEAKKAGIKQAPSSFWKRLAMKLDKTLKANSVLPTDHRIVSDRIYCATCAKTECLFVEQDGLLVVNQ